MLMFASVAYSSIAASSALEKSRLARAPTFSLSWVTLDAPISVETTRGSRSTHANAICARDLTVPVSDCFQSAEFCRNVAGNRRRGRVGRWVARLMSVAILRRPPRIQCVWHALVINVHVTNPAWPRQLNGIVPFWERFFVRRSVGCIFPTRQPQLPATPGEICFLT